MSKMEETEQESLFQQCNKVTSTLFATAQKIVIFRASIAYLLLQVKAFSNAIQPLRKQQCTKVHQRALERYLALMNSLLDLLSNFGENWTEKMINMKVSSITETVDMTRKNLAEICGQLDLDGSSLIQFDENQNLANKLSDFNFYKDKLLDFKAETLSKTNAVDLQQLIEERLYSLRMNIPKKHRHSISMKNPMSVVNDVNYITARLEEALNIFQYMNIEPNNIKVESTLGNGGFGNVFLGTILSTGEYMAIKEIKEDKITMGGLSTLFSEISVMSKLKHRHVIELTGIYNKKTYRILTRYCPGKSLFDRIHRPTTVLTPLQMTRVAYQIAKGMEYLHSIGVVHRDLKSLNVILDNHDAAIICDFGLCGLMTDGVKELTGGVGTPHYTAPEVLGHKKYNESCDVYSYAVILWEMQTTNIPYQNKCQTDIVEHVVKRGLRLKMPKVMPDGLRQLIVKSWSQNPAERPSFKEIVKQFESGHIYFENCPPITEVKMLYADSDEPPLNLKYIAQVLHEPANPNFNSVVDFITKDMSIETRQFLINQKILDFFRPEMPSPERRLYLSSFLLEDEEYDKVIPQAIETIKSLKDTNLIFSIKYALKVPERLLPQFEFFQQFVVDALHKDDFETACHSIQLLARFGSETCQKYHNDISSFLTAQNVSKVHDQHTVDSIVKIIPFILDDLKDSSLFISLLSGTFDIPADFQTFIVDRVGSGCIPTLFRAFLKSTRTHSVILKMLQMVKPSDIEEIIKDIHVFDDLQNLLKREASRESALMILYMLITYKSVPLLIVNHPILNDLLLIQGYERQRLMIFAALFVSEEFTKKATISDGALKLLMSALNDQKLATYALKIIGTLSFHRTGFAVIRDFGILPVFVQYFLSPNCSETQTGMTILINVSKFGEKIPQASLIISCLMQDLVDSMNSKHLVLQTMIAISNTSPEAFQTADLQYNILPLINAKEDPKTVLLVLELFNRVEVNLVKNFHRFLILTLLEQLSAPELQYPEILVQSVNLINTITGQFDIKDIVRESHIIDFFQSASGQMIQFSDIHSRMESSVSYLALIMKD